MTHQAEPLASPARPGRLAQLHASRLVRQNLVLFAGGLVAGVGGFVYHAIAGRRLGPALYGEVASLVAVYAVGTTVNLILILVLARYAAALQAEGRLGAISHLSRRTAGILVLPAVLLLGLSALLARPFADFLNLGSATAIAWLAGAISAIWYVAIPRGALQGTQRFTSLSANFALELLVRTTALLVLLNLGLAVNGAMIAILAGCLFGLGLGLASIHDLLALPPEPVRLRAMAHFAVTATVGTLGILLLYNVDVIMAKHYLDGHQAGIYGGLNKIGTIIYFLTLSVSQVLFPRVVEAVAQNRHPDRILLLSAGILAMLGLGTILVFAAVPGLVVATLFGPAFADAVPFILPVGFIGLGLALNNLLVQFFMAVHDRAFMPLLGLACLAEAVLIAARHRGVGDVVGDVLAAIFGLLLVLTVRAVILLPQLRPEMVIDEA